MCDSQRYAHAHKHTGAHAYVSTIVVRVQHTCKHGCLHACDVSAAIVTSRTTLLSTHTLPHQRCIHTTILLHNDLLWKLVLCNVQATKMWFWWIWIVSNPRMHTTTVWRWRQAEWWRLMQNNQPQQLKSIECCTSNQSVSIIFDPTTTDLLPIAATVSTRVAEQVFCIFFQSKCAHSQSNDDTTQWNTNASETSGPMRTNLRTYAHTYTHLHHSLVL